MYTLITDHIPHIALIFNLALLGIGLLLGIKIHTKFFTYIGPRYSFYRLRDK